MVRQFFFSHNRVIRKFLSSLYVCSNATINITAIIYQFNVFIAFRNLGAIWQSAMIKILNFYMLCHLFVDIQLFNWIQFDFTLWLQINEFMHNSSFCVILECGHAKTQTNRISLVSILGVEYLILSIQCCLAASYICMQQNSLVASVGGTFILGREHLHWNIYWI